MRKTHTKFFNKLNQFSDKPVDYWDHYDLLGYFCQQTGMEIKLIENEPPSWHPQVQLMNRLIAQLKNPKLRLKLSNNTIKTKGPNKGMRNDDCYDSVYTKDFLDFWIAICNRKNVKLTSVGYIAKNERCFSIFRKDPTPPKFKEIINPNDKINLLELSHSLNSSRDIDISTYFDICA